SIEFVTFTHRGVSGHELRRGDKSRHRRAKTAHHIHGHFDAINIDTRKFGSPFIATHGVHLSSERRLAGDKGGNRCEENHDPDDDRDAQDTAGTKDWKSRVAQLRISYQVGKSCSVIA